MRHLNAATLILLAMAAVPSAAFASPGPAKTAVEIVAKAPVGAQGSPAAATGYFQNIYTIEPGVWLLAEPRFQLQPIGNVTVIEQGDGLVLVDAGGSPGAGKRIVEMVRSLSPKPVKAVIISQWHGDKPQGLTEILKAWPDARTIATRVTQAHLANPDTMNTPAAPDAKRNAEYQKMIAGYLAYMRKEYEDATDPAMKRGFRDEVAMLQQYMADIDGALTITTKEAFDDSLTIADAKRPVTAMFLGKANTDGDAVVWLPRQRILVAGETVILPLPYGFNSFPSEWTRTLARMKALHYRVLIPGHGMAQRDTAQLDRISAALKDVVAQVKPLAAQGLSLDEVKQKVEFSAELKAFAGGDPWLRRWFRIFFLDPITESAYKEAKGEPIVQSLN